MNGFSRIGASFLIAVGLGLAGCGGGGGGGDDSPPAPKAEGAYAANGNDGSGIFALVLENDAFWGVYRLPPISARNVAGGEHGGFVQGSGASDNGSYTIADLRDYNFLDQIVETSSLRGTYIPGESLSATITPITPTPPDPAFQLVLTSSAVSGYDYNQPATAAAVTGRWTGFYGRSEKGTIDVTPQGTLSGTANGEDVNGVAYSCQFSGTIRPRASGKNVYDVTTTTDAASCGASVTTSGIGFVNNPTATTSQLVLMMTNESRSSGNTFIGSR